MRSPRGCRSSRWGLTQVQPVPREFNKTAPVVLQLGTAHNKNLPRLVEALKGTECRLEVVGKWNPQFAKFLSDAGIAHRFRSGLSSDEVVRGYEEADIVTLVSTLEGFGMPIVEAQAVGRVVVTSNVSSMPEVAGDGACLVDPLDVSAIRAGIRKVIDDGSYRGALISWGFETRNASIPDELPSSTSMSTDASLLPHRPVIGEDDDGKGATVTHVGIDGVGAKEGGGATVLRQVVGALLRRRDVEAVTVFTSPRELRSFSWVRTRDSRYETYPWRSGVVSIESGGISSGSTTPATGPVLLWSWRCRGLVSPLPS